MKINLFIVALLLGFVKAEAQKMVFPQLPGMVSCTYRNSLKTNVAATLATIRALEITDMEFSNLKAGADESPSVATQVPHSIAYLKNLKE